MVAGARRCPIRYFYYEVKCSLWITTTLWFLPNIKEVYLQIISTKSIFWNCRMTYNFMTFKTSHLNIIQNIFHISYINLKYSISSKILYRVRFIFLMCQLDFLFAVFFFPSVSDISFNNYYLRRGWIWHYSIKRQEILRCQSQIFYLNNHSSGPWVSYINLQQTFIYKLFMIIFQVHH